MHVKLKKVCTLRKDDIKTVQERKIGPGRIAQAKTRRAKTGYKAEFAEAARKKKAESVGAG